MTEPGEQRAPRSRATRIGMVVAVSAVAALLVGGTVAVAAAMNGGTLFAAAPIDTPSAATSSTPPAPTPTPIPTPTPTPTPVAACARPGVATALKKGDDVAVIAAMGGAEAMRAAVAAGAAPCINLSDPARIWVVVNKIRPLKPLDYWPATLAAVNDVQSLSGSWVRKDAGIAMTKLVEASRAAGAGDMAMESAFRSYPSQVKTYGNHVASKGRANADKVSARPGYSEHQSGLAADVVACNGGCGSLDNLATTKQGKWLKENAWRYGFVVRYEQCCTKTTGYLAEPWHIRFIGTALAQAYHDGGFHSLEEFWGLPAAPGYTD